MRWHLPNLEIIVQQVCSCSAQNSHVALVIERSLHDGLHCHPSQWKLSVSVLYIQLICPSQTKVWYFQYLVFINKDVAASKVTVHNGNAGQVLLQPNVRVITIVNHKGRLQWYHLIKVHLWLMSMDSVTKHHMVAGEAHQVAHHPHGNLVCKGNEIQGLQLP